MKKALLIGIAMLFAASAVSAAPAVPYVGIYSDLNHSVCSYMGTAASTFIYVFGLPSVNGMLGAEFMLGLSNEDFSFGATTWNPLVAASLGSVDAGCSATFGACQTDWTWVCKVRLYQAYPEVGCVSIEMDPTAKPPRFMFLNCNYSFEDPIRLDQFCVQQGCVIGAKDASWGAIKSLF